MFEKIKQFFNYWASTVSQLFNEKRYFLAGLTFLPPIVLVGLLIGLVIKGIMAGVSFLFRHSAQLIFVAIVICGVIAWWDKRKAEKIKIEWEKWKLREQQEYSDRFEAAQTREATYAEQGKIVFSVSRELGPLGIVSPATPSNIYSPGRTISKAGGTVNVSLFLLQKDRETIDTDLLKHTMQTKIDQRLQAGEFPGVPEQYIYRGRVYSGFVVDMVRDRHSRPRPPPKEEEQPEFALPPANEDSRRVFAYLRKLWQSYLLPCFG